MKNKKVLSAIVMSFLIVGGMFLIFLANARRGGVTTSLLTSLLVFLITVLFMLTVVYLYKKFYQEKVYGFATLTKRFWAFALDYLFLHILAHIIMVLVVIFLGDFKENYNGLLVALYGGRDALFLTELGVMGVYCIYSIVLDVNGGTLGRKAMDALVVDASGEPANVKQHVIRNVIKWLMYIPALFMLLFPYVEIHSYDFYFLRVFLLIYIYPKMNPERLFLQDFISRTKVLDTKYGQQVLLNK